MTFIDSPADVVAGGRVAINDTELFLDTIGAGAPMLVLHGGLGVDHTYFRPWLDSLADVAELTYFDHRGNGRSARSPLDDVDHDTWVADIDAVRAHLGHEQVLLLGHSYGGFLALRYVVSHPERVRALVLVGTAPVMDHWERVLENVAALGATQEQLRAFEDGPFDDDDDAGAALKALFPLYFHRPNPEVLTRLGATMRFSAEASRAGDRCLEGYDVRKALPSIEVPALVLGGRHDFIMPPDLTLEPLADALPHAELVVFEDSGHFPFIEERDKFVDVVRRWLTTME